MSPSLQLTDALAAACSRAEEAASQALLEERKRDGHWCADLTADTTLESDYILLQLWLHPPVDGVWKPATMPVVRKAVESILKRQLPDGGFNVYPQGPAEVSASVKAYFALKLAGLPVSDPRMQRLRDRILEAGGLQAANSYVKINLSLFGLYPRHCCPAIPVELMLQEHLIYRMSAWTRAIVVPLSIVYSSRVTRPVPAGFHLQELAAPNRSYCVDPGDGWMTWRRFFLALDHLAKAWDRMAPRAIRRLALQRAERWMLEHCRNSDGLGAIFPAMMYSIMAMDVLGYEAGHPARVEAIRQFNKLVIDDGNRFFIQPCFSPVWDTAIAAYCLAESGQIAARELESTADWLLSKEVRNRGDWSKRRPGLEPSGWYFEYANEHYPDIDDTAMVLLALARTGASSTTRQKAAIGRAVNWLLGMQSRDGGWAAFDADNNWRFLNHVPFADHNAMLDPTCPDITGRVLEALAAHDVGGSHAAVRRGVTYLQRRQEQDGSWPGRWGVNYIYGTCMALRGLRAAGESPWEAYILRAGEWLRSIQNADGGWGESCSSYDAGCFTAARSTASQTAWAVLGLVAAGDTHSESVRRGVEFLLETQRRDGRWDEELATGTGFPRVFYLTYHLYRDAFPLLALAAWRKGQAQQGDDLT